MTLTLASTCAGIGGFDVAWEQTGVRCTIQVEVGDARRALLARHWKHVPDRADIVDVRGADLGRPDILVGGLRSARHAAQVGAARVRFVRRTT